MSDRPKYLSLTNRLGCASAAIFAIAECVSILCSEAFLSYAISPEAESLLDLCIAVSYSASLVCWATFSRANSEEVGTAVKLKSFLLAYSLFSLFDITTFLLPNTDPLWTIGLSFVYGIVFFLYLKHLPCEGSPLSFDALWFISGMLAYRVAGFLVNGIALTYGFSSGLFSNQRNVWFWIIPPAVLLGLAWYQRETRCKRLDGADGPTQRPRLSGKAAKPLSARESEIMARDLLGEETCSISRTMGIAPGTISTLRSRARAKLNISPRSSLGRLAGDGEIGVDISAGVPSSHHRSWKYLTISLMAALVVIASSSSDTITLPNGDQLFQVSYYFIWGSGVLLIIAGLACVDPLSKGTPYRALPSVPTEIAVALCSLSTFIIIGTQLYLDPLTVGSLIGCMALLFGLLHTHDKNEEWTSLFHVIPFYSGIGLILSPVIGTYQGLWGTPVLLDFIICGIALRSLFMRHEANRNAKQTARNQEANGMLLLSEYGIQGLQAHVVLDLAKGLTVKEICETRSTTENTVKSYRSRAYKKLDVHSVEELREKLATPPHRNG